MESKTNYRSPEAINLPYQTLSSTRKVPYQLLQKITDSLSDERKVGSGAFGTVYKGVHENGETIAVKVLRYVIDIDSKQFQNEFQNLAKLKHRNVVELVGYCNETEQVIVEHQGKRVIADQIHMALCMEYIDNGSLSEHIDGTILRFFSSAGIIPFFIVDRPFSSAVWTPPSPPIPPLFCCHRVLLVRLPPPGSPSRTAATAEFSSLDCRRR
ncbi:hypothetical protein PR202_gb27468 [Eleusine coracana subsp. coracana]|uniref:Protein kinase domain-containing protein n=1 Tax=Eleusine coracana subsp. coracana TaxID=191504 RepID=A0AAV5FV35_ELECO|nr:hypothetical protein PR202_gb27468 [Eleusine coracana subsp. coracana]